MNPATTATTTQQPNQKFNIKAWLYDMHGHSEQVVERYCELAKVAVSTLRPVYTPCIDDHQLNPDDFEKPGVLTVEAAKIVLKALYVARMGRPDALWTVNSLAREVTRWTVACDKRLLRLVSYLHFNKHWSQTSFLGDEAKDCYLALFCDASFADNLRDSKSTTGGYLCLVGPHTFCPITWMCKKQGAVSHSSTEAEIIALEACVRMMGIPMLQLWDLVIDVFHPQPTQNQNNETQLNLNDNAYQILSNVDNVPSNAPISTQRTKLIIFEDNEAVIKMIIKGRSPNMRHVLRVHRIDLDWLFERLQLDNNIRVRYVSTKQQIADMFTKGSFVSQQWSHLCKLAQIGENKSPIKEPNANIE